jgi:hypothetical protein
VIERKRKSIRHWICLERGMGTILPRKTTTNRFKAKSNVLITSWNLSSKSPRNPVKYFFSPPSFPILSLLLLVGSIRRLNGNQSR